MLTPLEERVVLSMCRNDLVMTRTAKDLHYCHHSIIYHVEKIKEKTGYDVRTFYGALSLLFMIGGVQECGYPKKSIT